MNLKIFIFCVAAAVLFAAPALADDTATIHGVVYSWDTFEILENAIVEVNSTPSQSMVAKYGLYYFDLDPGVYLISASYYENSTLIYSGEKEFTIVEGEGSYNSDLLLLPVYSTVLMEGDTNNPNVSSSNTSDSDKASDVNTNITESSKINGSTSSTGYYLLAALVLTLLLTGGFSLQKQRNNEKKKQESEKADKSKLETTKLEKKRLQEEKAVQEIAVQKAEETSPAISISNIPADLSDEGITQPIEIAEPITQLTEESGSELSEKEIRTVSKAEQLIPGPSELKLEAEGPQEKASEPSAEEASGESTAEAEPVSEPTKQPEPEAPAVKKNLPLPSDLQEVMDIIRGQGGRITQKDLRSKLKYSEGKVSLMLADLERRELIEKFKRGRGNVVIIRDEER